MRNVRAFVEAGGGNAEWDFIVFRHNEHQVEQARMLADGPLGFSMFEDVGEWQDRGAHGIRQTRIYRLDTEPKIVMARWSITWPAPSTRPSRTRPWPSCKTCGLGTAAWITTWTKRKFNASCRQTIRSTSRPRDMYCRAVGSPDRCVTHPCASARRSSNCWMCSAAPSTSMAGNAAFGRSLKMTFSKSWFQAAGASRAARKENCGRAHGSAATTSSNSRPRAR